MIFFDTAKDWTILAPLSVPAARQGAEELSRYIQRLRPRGAKPPAIREAEAPADSAPLILLHPGDGGPERNGFDWRLGTDRLEIYGASGRGLWNGIFDFLKALGIRWPEPGREELPVAGPYPLGEGRARRVSAPSTAELPRLLAGPAKKPRDREALIRWAARNNIDAVIFSLRDRRPKKSRPPESPDAAEYYGLIQEAGGRELSLLVPRRYFLLRRELFRMESGRRVRDLHFCPTNPETIRVLKKEAARLFGSFLRRAPAIRTIHLWPGRGAETRWCSCPACRAFSAEDQYRIAVNSAADVLAELAPAARISLYETPDEAGEDEEKEDRINIPLRPNVFKLKRPPVEA